MAESKDDIERVDMSSAPKGREEPKAAPDEGLELDGMGLDAETVDTASDLKTIEEALGSLEDPENPGVAAKQLQAAMKVAMNVAAKVLDSNDAITSEPEKTLEAALAYALERMNEDEQSRQFLINYLKWCRDQLNIQQQNALRASATLEVAAAPAPAPSSYTALAVALGFTLNQLLEAAKALLASKEEQVKNTIVITTKEDKEIQAFLENKTALAAQGLEYTKNADGSGILTRLSQNGSPYSAHFTSDGNGGFKVAITGSNPQEGLKDVLGVFKDAGITAVRISGGATKDDAKAYQALKTALGVEGITAVLDDKDVLGSVELFAKEGAKVDLTASKTDTENYLKKIIDNKALKPKLIAEMVTVGHGKKEALEAMDSEKLIATVLEAVTPKPALGAQPTGEQAQSIETPKAGSETVSIGGGTVSLEEGNKVSFNGVSNVSVMTDGQTATISQKPTSAEGSRPTPKPAPSRLGNSERLKQDNAGAAGFESRTNSGNVSIQTDSTGKETTVIQEESGQVTVNGRQVEGDFSRSLNVSQDSQGRTILNGAPVQYKKYKNDDGMLSSSADKNTAGPRSEPSPEEQQRRSPGAIPKPGEIPTLIRK